MRMFEGAYPHPQLSNAAWQQPKLAHIAFPVPTRYSPVSPFCQIFYKSLMPTFQKDYIPIIFNLLANNFSFADALCLVSGFHRDPPIFQIATMGWLGRKHQKAIVLNLVGFVSSSMQLKTAFAQA